MSHPIPTVAALKRTLTAGTPIHVENHVRPAGTRTTTVHGKTNTVDLVTYAYDGAGKLVGSHLRWPKAKEYRPDATDPRKVHIDHAEGIAFLTVTLLDPDAEHDGILTDQSPLHRAPQEA